jgi:hypothetical protein
VGINCHFDPFVAIETMKLMKQGLEEAGLLDKVYLMCQPLAYHTPDAGKQGFIDLPEFPFALVPILSILFMNVIGSIYQYIILKLYVDKKFSCIIDLKY